MNNKSYSVIEYRVEYVENNTPWTVAEFLTDHEAFDRLEKCRQGAPSRDWQVSKVTHLHQRVVRTSEGRTIEL